MISEMTSQASNEPSLSQLFIEFDGRQLEVRTNIPDVHDFLRQVYSAMLAPSLTSTAGRLDVIKNRRGISVVGMDTTDFGDTHLHAYSDWIKRDVLQQFIRSRPDLLWIHAAVVEREGSAMLLVGPSGQGKSTISTRLCELGWRLLSDDAGPTRMDADEVLPYPQSPFRRKYPGREFAAHELGSFEREHVLMPDSALHLEAAPIRSIVFPLFKHGSEPEISLRPPGEAALDLLRNCTNFADHKDTAVERIARLARVVPMHHLSYGDGQAAARALDAISS